MVKPHKSLTRRKLLEKSGLGFGSLALSYLLHAEDSAGGALYKDLRSRQGHFRASAKSVIHLMQSGGPSQIDLFDPKPELVKRVGQPHPQGVETFQVNNRNVLMPPVFEFKRRGKCGMELADVIPHIGGIADELCLVRSWYTENNNHPEAVTMLQTCKVFRGRPAMGSWISYALGTESQNLPAYVVLRDPAGYSSSGKTVWSSGFLPALYQGVEVSSSGAPVQHLSPALPVPPGAQHDELDLLATLNTIHKREHPLESELESRIQNYELAARMQLAAAEVLDLSKESEETKKMYGLDNPVTVGYGLRCLMARRLIEAGVRFVQVFPPLNPTFNPWDTHGEIKKGLETICARTDQPFAALVRDLKGRGLLDSTIVLWAGEFGRLPTSQPNPAGGGGRDHNRHGGAVLLAGGGFRPGLVFGESDDFGYKAVVNRVSVPDLHATIYQLLGLDHSRLGYPYHGIIETATDAKVNGARVVAELLRSPSTQNTTQHG